MCKTLRKETVLVKAEVMYTRIIDEIRTERKKTPELKETEEIQHTRAEKQVADMEPEKLLDEIVSVKMAEAVAAELCQTGSAGKVQKSIPQQAAPVPQA